MLIARLAVRSLRSRLFTTALTLASIALSVTLLVGIEHVRTSVRDSFAGTIRGTDLIVGTRGGSLQVLLSTVFGIGSPAGSVSMATFAKWQQHPAVKWAVPFSLGDSHRGFRVVGTTAEYFERYRYRDNQSIRFAVGGVFSEHEDVVIGSEVASRLGYTVGSPIVVTHGLRDIGTSGHDDHPLRVVGVLERTFTPIDRAVYVTLEGLREMHEEDPSGTGAGAGAGDGASAASPPAMPGAGVPPAMPGAAVPPVMPGAVAPPVMPGAEPPPAMPGAVAPQAAASVADNESSADTGDTGDAISAFFVGTQNRFEALMLQREMNTDFSEPLTAVIPGVALGELWQNIGTAEVGLRVVAGFAVAIGLTGMLVALYSSLDSRRREMAILRSAGAGPRTIVSLLVLESALLSIVGCIIGVALVYIGLALAQGPVEQRFGLHLAMHAPGKVEWLYLATVSIAGTIIGFVPAIKAYRTSLADGLSPR